MFCNGNVNIYNNRSSDIKGQRCRVVLFQITATSHMSLHTMYFNKLMLPIETNLTYDMHLSLKMDVTILYMKSPLAYINNHIQVHIT